MSLKRWAAKRDANEQAIKAALERAGARVERLSDKGVCDLLVLFRDELFMLECKSHSGRATAAQERRAREGWPVRTGRTEEEALKAIGAV